MRDLWYSRQLALLSTSVSFTFALFILSVFTIHGPLYHKISCILWSLYCSLWLLQTITSTSPAPHPKYLQLPPWCYSLLCHKWFPIWVSYPRKQFRDNLDAPLLWHEEYYCFSLVTASLDQKAENVSHIFSVSSSKLLCTYLINDDK